MDGGFPAIDAIEDYERVDLEVREVEVDVDGVQADEEVGKGLLLGCGDVLEERARESLARRERRADRDLKGKRLRIDVADVDTAFVCEQDVITLTLGVDADIVLRVRRMRKEGLKDEVVESAGDGLDLQNEQGRSA